MHKVLLSVKYLVQTSAKGLTSVSQVSAKGLTSVSQVSAKGLTSVSQVSAKYQLRCDKVALFCSNNTVTYNY